MIQLSDDREALREGDGKGVQSERTRVNGLIQKNRILGWGGVGGTS